MNTTAAQEYVIRALVYSASWSIDDPVEGGTGRDVADFMLRAVSDAAMKRQSYVLHGVHTATWWRMLRTAYAKLGDLDEWKLKEFLEASGFWFWGIKPQNSKQIISTQNIGRIYDRDLALNGWRLIANQRALRTVIDRINEGK